MKLAWTVGGALLGRALFGRLGLVAGGILGYAMAPGRDGGKGVRPPSTRPEPEAKTASGTTAEAELHGERYPEETVIDAMRETEETLWQEEIAGETQHDREG